MIDLSIIIPAYKEENRLGSTLDKLSSFIANNTLRAIDVWVVVANSPDRTLDIAKNKSRLFERYHVIDAGSRAGKGRDVRLAMKQAKGEYKMFMDADLATPLHHLNEVFRLMQEKTDIIIGVRNLHNSHSGWRNIVSRGGNVLVRTVLGIDIKDTQCGFKAFQRAVADDLFNVQSIKGWGFDIELLAIATERGYTIGTIPIDDWCDVEGGTFEHAAIRGTLSTLKELCTIKWNLLTGEYKSMPDATSVLRNVEV